MILFSKIKKASNDHLDKVVCKKGAKKAFDTSVSTYFFCLFSSGGETWSTATDDLNMPSSGGGQISSPDSSDYHSAGNMESHNGNVSDSPSPHGIGGFQCGKCSMKFQDTESFRGHVEKCFN